MRPRCPTHFVAIFTFCTKYVYASRLQLHGPNYDEQRLCTSSLGSRDLPPAPRRNINLTDLLASFSSSLDKTSRAQRLVCTQHKERPSFTWNVLVRGKSFFSPIIVQKLAQTHLGTSVHKDGTELKGGTENIVIWQ